MVHILFEHYRFVVMKVQILLLGRISVSKGLAMIGIVNAGK